MSAVEYIAGTTLTTAAASVTFSSIPQVYSDLVLVANAQSVSASTTWGSTIRLNGDSGTNYSQSYMYGSGSSAVSSRQSNQDMMRVGMDFPTSPNWDTALMNVPQYANTAMFKTVLTVNGSASLGPLALVGLWRSTAAVTSLTLYGNNSGGINMVAGSTFSLWGVK